MKSVIAVSSLVLLAMVSVSQAQGFGSAPPPTEPAQGMDPTMMMMMVSSWKILVHKIKPLCSLLQVMMMNQKDGESDMMPMIMMMMMGNQQPGQSNMMMPMLMMTMMDKVI